LILEYLALIDPVVDELGSRDAINDIREYSGDRDRERTGS
jgi:hypothetical protein